MTEVDDLYMIEKYSASPNLGIHKVETMKIKQSYEFVVNICFGFRQERGIARYPSTIG